VDFFQKRVQKLFSRLNVRKLVQSCNCAFLQIDKVFSSGENFRGALLSSSIINTWISANVDFEKSMFPIMAFHISAAMHMYSFALRIFVVLSLSLALGITALNRRSQDHVRASCGRPIGFRREYFAAISHHYSRALQDGVWFSMVAGRWFASVDRNVVSISVIGVGVAGAYISSERGFSKIDERAGLPPHARTRCIQVPHLVFMIARGVGRYGRRAVDRGRKKIWKNQVLHGKGRDASPKIRAKTQCVLLTHGDGSFLAILFRRFASRGRRFIGSRLNVKHCTRSSLPDKFCIRLHIKVDANVTLLQVCW